LHICSITNYFFFQLGGQQLPGVAELYHGQISEQESKLIFNGSNSKITSYFMKLRAQEEIEYIKVLLKPWKG
jgi:hypothetical protein